MLVFLPLNGIMPAFVNWMVISTWKNHLFERFLRKKWARYRPELLKNIRKWNKPFALTQPIPSLFLEKPVYLTAIFLWPILFFHCNQFSMIFKILFLSFWKEQCLSYFRRKKIPFRAIKAVITLILRFKIINLPPNKYF